MKRIGKALVIGLAAIGALLLLFMFCLIPSGPVFKGDAQPLNLQADEIDLIIVGEEFSPASASLDELLVGEAGEPHVTVTDPEIIRRCVREVNGLSYEQGFYRTLSRRMLMEEGGQTDFTFVSDQKVKARMKYHIPRLVWSGERNEWFVIKFERMPTLSKLQNLAWIRRLIWKLEDYAARDEWDERETISVGCRLATLVGLLPDWRPPAVAEDLRRRDPHEELVSSPSELRELLKTVPRYTVDDLEKIHIVQ